MPLFCANLAMLHAERAFLDRFAAARADGFEAAEHKVSSSAGLGWLRACLRAAGTAVA
jgi:2-dehydrotetronate isomerase